MYSWFLLSIKEKDDPGLGPINGAFEESNFHIHAVQHALHQFRSKSGGQTVETRSRNRRRISASVAAWPSPMSGVSALSIVTILE